MKKKETEITVRISKNDYELFKQKAFEADLSMTDYFLWLMRKEPVLSGVSFEILDNACKHFSEAGVRLNNIAHALNDVTFYIHYSKGDLITVKKDISDELKILLEVISGRSKSVQRCTLSVKSDRYEKIHFRVGAEEREYIYSVVNDTGKSIAEYVMLMLNDKPIKSKKKTGKWVELRNEIRRIQVNASQIMVALSGEYYKGLGDGVMFEELIDELKVVQKNLIYLLE